MTAADSGNGETVIAVEEDEPPASEDASAPTEESPVGAEAETVEVTAETFDKVHQIIADGKCGENITWRLDNDGVLTVDEDSGATFTSTTGKTGSVTITAKALDGSGKSTKVTVKLGRFASDIETLNAPAELRGGASVTLKTSIDNDKTLTDRTDEWTLDDSSIPYATLSKNKLTAKTVTVPWLGENSTTYTPGILFYDNTLGSIDNSFSPTDAEWRSGSTAVADVDECGNVTFHKAGSVTITASFNGLTAKVTLKAVVPVTQVDIVEPESTVLTAGQSITLKANVGPDNAAAKTLVWSADSDAVTVVNGKVTANNVAVRTLVTIDVWAADFYRAGDSITLTILPKVNSIQIYNVKRLMNNRTETVSLSDPDAIRSLWVKVLPEGELGAEQSVDWSSSNKAVADVDENGNVTLLKKGTVTITAAARDGSKVSASFQLTVTD